MRDDETRAPDGDDWLPLPDGARVSRIDEGLALIELPIPYPELPEPLTEAEQEVAVAVFEGASNQEIARARGVSAKTIGNQLESLYRKLGVGSRAELVLKLRRVPS